MYNNIMLTLASGCYGGLSWIPVLDTTKQLGNKSDHYFIVGMTHNPDELRYIIIVYKNFTEISREYTE